MHDGTIFGDFLVVSFERGLTPPTLLQDLIAKANVFEEEDFQPVTYCFNLCCDITEQKTISMLKEAEDDIQKKLRSTKVGGSTGGELPAWKKEATFSFLAFQFSHP